MHMWPLVGNLVSEQKFERYIGILRKTEYGLGLDDLGDLSLFCKCDDGIVITQLMPFMGNTCLSI